MKKQEPLNDAPVSTKCPLPINFFTEEKFVFTYPLDVNFYYIKKGQLIQLSLVFGENIILKKFAFNQGKNVNLHPIRLVKGPHHSLIVLFEQRVPSGHESYCYLYFSDINADEDLFNPPEGRDAVFLSKSEQFLILSNDGKSVSHFSAGKLVTTYEGWEKPLHRMFATPLVKGKGILYYDRKENCLLWSRNVGSRAAVRGFAPDEFSPKFQLEKDEILLDVQWQSVEGGFVAAVMTTVRLSLVNRDFKVLTSVYAPVPSSLPHFNSCLWLGASLLYSVSSPPQLCYLTLDGTSSSLSSLKHSKAILSAVLNDRVLYLQPSLNDTEVYSQAVGLLEPLMLGFILVPPNRKDPNCREKFSNLLSRFDCTRITERLIAELDRRGFSDFAFALLSKNKPFKHYQLRVAENALYFKAAFDTLFDQYKSEFIPKKEKKEEKSKHKNEANPKENGETPAPSPVAPEVEETPVFPLVPPSAPLHSKFRELGDLCVTFGQFAFARRCFELIGDFISLLDLFVTHKHKEGLQFLMEASKTANSSSQISRAISSACSHFLQLPHNPPLGSSSLVDWRFLSQYPSNPPQTVQVVSDTMKCIVGNGDLEAIPLLDELDTILKWLPFRIEYYSEKAGKVSATAVKPNQSNNNIHVPQSPLMIDTDNSEEVDLEGAEHVDSPVQSLPVPPRALTVKPSLLTSCATSNLKKRLFTHLEEAESEDSEAPGESSDPIRTSLRIPLRIAFPTDSPRTPVTPGTPQKDSPQRSEASLPPKKSEELTIKDVTSQMDSNSFRGSSYDDQTLQKYASEFLINGLKKLESNAFLDALEDVNKSVKCLLSTSDPFSKKKEIGICVNYKLALKLFVLIGNLKKERALNASKLALFTTMLCTVAMQKKHRIVCFTNAINENLQSKNYGVAYKLIRQITSKEPSLSDSFAPYLEICQTNKLQDQFPWGSTLEISTMRFCYKKLELLSEKDPSKTCELCKAIFSTDVVEDVCSYCTHGKFTN